MKIHHIGIVVESIDGNLKMYSELGYTKISDIIEDHIQNNRIVFISDKNNNHILELIEPLNEKSTVYNKNNYGYHHICYEVVNLQEFTDEFGKKKIGKIFTSTIKAPAIENKYIMFAYLKNGTIIEFLEIGE